LFKDHVNLPNSHPYIFGHCWMFSIKNLIFGLLDHITPNFLRKLEEEKKQGLYKTEFQNLKILSFRSIFDFFSSYFSGKFEEKNYISFI